MAKALNLELYDLFVNVKVKQGSKSAKKIKNIINKISAKNDDTILAVDKVVSEIYGVVGGEGLTFNLRYLPIVFF